MAIRIVTDSSADLPAELARQRQITVLPSYVMINGVSYQDGVDLSHDDFYQRLVSMERPPTTAQPSTADFQSAYSTLLEQGDQILSIHLSAKLSGTLNSAEQAKSAQSADAAIKSIRPPVHFRVAEAMRRQIGRWPARRLATAMAITLEAEIDCKTTGNPAEAVCSRALMRVARAAAR